MSAVDRPDRKLLRARAVLVLLLIAVGMGALGGRLLHRYRHKLRDHGATHVRTDETRRMWEHFDAGDQAALAELVKRAGTPAGASAREMAERRFLAELLSGGAPDPEAFGEPEAHALRARAFLLHIEGSEAAAEAASWREGFEAAFPKSWVLRTRAWREGRTP